GKRAIELHSNFAVGLYALGLTYCRTRQFDRACDAFDRLLVLSDRSTYFVAWSALVHGLAGERNKALKLSAGVGSKHSSECIHPLTSVLIGMALRDRAATANALRGYTMKNGSGFQVAHILPFLRDWRFEPAFV